MPTTAKRKTIQASQPGQARSLTSQPGQASQGELVTPDAPFVPATPAQQTKAVVRAMQQQHPIYGAFGLVFEQLGGVDGLAEWAEDNPTDFFRIFSRMVPQDHQGSGQINIQINNQLGPTALDG